MDNGIGGEWRMMTMRLHDERRWKRGRSQILWRNNMHTWDLKSSHTEKACVLSNHVKFRHMHAQVEGIATLAPFTGQHVASVDNGINDGLIYWKMFVIFQECFEKDSIDGNCKRWQRDRMMNIEDNVDDIKHYACTTCILEPWNPPTLRRHVSCLTMSNSTHIGTSWRDFNIGPIHYSTCDVGG
jgi:hypothetical protein